MKYLELGKKVKIKRGTRIFYNLGANSFKKKGSDWVINQMNEENAKKLNGTYSKKIFFDGTVLVSDPEIVHGEDMRFCEVALNEERFHLLIDDTYDLKQKREDQSPPKNWSF